MARRISDGQIDRAIELLRSGARVDEAAVTAGIGETALRVHLRRRGLTTEGTPGPVGGRRRPPTERRAAERARRDTAFALRVRGLTFAKMGAELGVSEVQAYTLWRAALRDRGVEAPVRQVAVRVPNRRVETVEQLGRLRRAMIAGDLCGWCGRTLDSGETVYVDSFPVDVKRQVGSSASRVPKWVRAPVGTECASPRLLAAVAGQQSEPCVSCGRGVFYGRSNARRTRTTCSRRCLQKDSKRRRREAD